MLVEEHVQVMALGLSGFPLRLHAILGFFLCLAGHVNTQFFAQGAIRTFGKGTQTLLLVFAAADAAHLQFGGVVGVDVRQR